MPKLVNFIHKDIVIVKKYAIIESHKEVSIMKIGLRTLKSAIAVLLSLLVFLILYGLNQVCGFSEYTPGQLVTMEEYWYAPTNFYTPFFAGIAAVYAMQQNISASRNQAKIRSFGSIIGGYFGFVVIGIFEWFYFDLFQAEKYTLVYYILLFTIASAGILFLIPLTVRLNIRSATFVACLTYLSVTISIRNGGMNSFLFTTNRVLSTVVGVLISLFVNTFPQHHIKNKNVLFISSLDNAMLNAKHELTPFMEYKLNNLIGRDCNLTFMTTRALTSLTRIFKNVHLKNELIVMTGCALYDPVKASYNGVIYVGKDLRHYPEDLFEQFHFDYFSYVINNSVMHCYYNDMTGLGSKKYYERRKHSSQYSFVQGVVPAHLDVAQYVVIEKEHRIKEFIKQFKASPQAEEYSLIEYPFADQAGYSFLKINYKHALKEVALDKLKYSNKYDYLICFGSGHTDIESMKKADFAVCLSSAPAYVEEVADYVIPSDEPEEIVKLIEKIYHKRNYKKYLEKLKAQPRRW